MADISGLDSMTCEEFRFKRENAEQPVDGPLHERQPAFPPGPHLGRNQVDHGNLQILKTAGKAKMEIRAIRNDANFSPLLFRIPHPFTLPPINPSNIPHYF